MTPGDKEPSVTAKLAGRLRDLGLHEMAASLAACRRERGGACRRSTCPRCAARRAKRDRAALTARLGAVPDGRTVIHFVARAAGEDVAAAATRARGAFDRLRRQDAWGAVEAGEMHIHPDPTGVEVDAVLVLKSGAAFPEADVRRAWKRLLDGRGWVKKCDAVGAGKPLDDAACFATARALSFLLDAPDAWLKAWALWAGRARSARRFGSWYGAKRCGLACSRMRTCVLPDVDLDTPEISSETQTESLGYSVPQTPNLGTSGRPSVPGPFRNDSSQEGEREPICPPAEGPPPELRAAPLRAPARPKPKDVVARLLEVGVTDVQVIVDALRPCCPGADRWGETLADAAFALAVREEDDLARALDDLGRFPPPFAERPAVQRTPERAVHAEAAAVRRLRRGDVVEFAHPAFAARFTKHGAYPAEDLSRMTVDHVREAEGEAEVLSARGERLGRVLLSRLVLHQQAA